MAARQSSSGKIKTESAARNTGAEVTHEAFGGRREVFGGLPDPEELAKYEKIIPGGAERILEMAEADARHRLACQDKDAQSRVRTARIKQLMTFVLALVAGVFGGILMVMGSELAGLIIILIDAVAVVGVVVYGNRLDSGV